MNTILQSHEISKITDDDNENEDRNDDGDDVERANLTAMLPTDNAGDETKLALDSIEAMTMLSTYGAGNGTKLALDFYGSFSAASLISHLDEARRLVLLEGIEFDVLQLRVPESLSDVLRGISDGQSFCGTNMGLEMPVGETKRKSS